MIWESWPWKKELLVLANKLEELLDAYSSEQTEEEYCLTVFNLEKTIFYSAFIIRKLIENRKLTDKCSKQKIIVQVFLATDTQPSIRNTLGIEMGVDFNLEHNNSIEFPLGKLMNEIIHSFLLEWEVDSDGILKTIFISSYKNQKNRSIGLGFQDYLKAIRNIANDEVTSSQYYLDPETGKFIAKLQ